jgi:hypothetical protein
MTGGLEIGGSACGYLADFASLAAQLWSTRQAVDLYVYATAPSASTSASAARCVLVSFTQTACRCSKSDLRCYLAWFAERGLDPLAAQRPHLELYIRWMQEIRRFKPSTVSRRFSVVAGFYPDLRHRRHPGAFTLRTCPPSLGPR